MPQMHSYLRLNDVCPAYREALDAYERVMDGDTKTAELAWERVLKAARDFRARVTPMMRE